MPSRFDKGQAYAFEGDLLQKLERVAVRLGAERPISLDEGRRLCSGIMRILDTATRMERCDDD